MAALQGPLPRAPRLGAAQRRDQLAHFAAQQFQQDGYHRVSLADVATQAGVTGPAVYRHFRNKQALLAAAITSGLDLVEDAVIRTSGGSLDEMVSAVAEVGLHRPDMWVLLQRESRFLGEDMAAPIHAQFGRVIDRFSRRLRKERPALTSDEAHLLVTAAMAVLSLPSTTHTSLSMPEYRRELTAAALLSLRADLTAVDGCESAPRAGEPIGHGPSSRREQVVDSAIDLFSRRGYSAVSLDDIGGSIGIAGPSILHHFATKADILVSAFDRASSRLDADQKRRRLAGAAPGLQDLVASYIGFSLQNRNLLGVYISEAMNLPEGARQRTADTVRTELRDWTRALLASSLDLDERLAHLRVRAALAAISDLVRLGQFASRPHIGCEIEIVALAVLRGDHHPPR